MKNFPKRKVIPSVCYKKIIAEIMHDVEINYLYLVTQVTNTISIDQSIGNG